MLLKAYRYWVVGLSYILNLAYRAVYKIHHITSLAIGSGWDSEFPIVGSRYDAVGCVGKFTGRQRGFPQGLKPRVILSLLSFECTRMSLRFRFRLKVTMILWLSKGGWVFRRRKVELRIWVEITLWEGSKVKISGMLVS